MKLSNANKCRAEWVEKLTKFVSGLEEDVGVIASNSFNFPVAVDGDEGWVEIVVKVVKDDEGYEKREQYNDKMKEKERKAKENAEKKAKKIERDKKAREAKQKAKEKKN